MIMINLPEPSGVAPSDGWFGQGIAPPITEYSVAPHVPGDEAASGYRQIAQTRPYNDFYHAEGPPKGVNAVIPENGYISNEDGPHQPPPHCYCGLATTRLMSKSERNPNRWFLKCPKFKDDPTQCKFFVWEDECDNQSKSPGPPPATRRRVDNTVNPLNPSTTTYAVPPSAQPQYNTDTGAIYGTNYHNFAVTEPHANFNKTNENYVANTGTTERSPSVQPRDRSNDECFHCGGKGHWSSECPMTKQQVKTVGGSGGGTAGSCFKCGQEGHWSRDCPNGPKASQQHQTVYGAANNDLNMYASGGFGSNISQPGGVGTGNAPPASGSCFKCGQEGHWSRDCPNGPKTSQQQPQHQGFGGPQLGYTNFGSNTNSRLGTCYKCGGEGHWAKDCTQSSNATRYNNNNNSYGGVGNKRRYGDSGSGGGSCYKCGQSGHWSRDCPTR